MFRRVHKLFRIQHCAALAFQEFHGAFRLFILYAHFLQRCAKMFQKRVEVRVVESRLQMCMGRADIPACIRFRPAEQRGDKRDLMRA